MPLKTDPVRRRGPGWIELSVALAALVVSAVSLYIAHRQTNVMHQQLAASTWPALQYSTSNLHGGEPVISMSLMNGGVGPARIYAFRVFHEGRPVPDLNGFIDECCVPEGASATTITSFVEGRILPAGQSIDFLVLPADPDHPEIYDRFNRVRTELDIRFCYCSVLEECWERGRAGTALEPVRSCEGQDGAVTADR
jgi:hypothetical protein